jgi:hypothetical protein
MCSELLQWTAAHAQRRRRRMVDAVTRRYPSAAPTMVGTRARSRDSGIIRHVSTIAGRVDFVGR